MKVLVTGGAGYLGSHVVDQLRKRGHEVDVVDSLLYSNFYARPDVRFILMDITSKDFAHYLSFVKYDAIVNTAAIVGDPACKVSESLSWDVNTHAVSDMVTAMVNGPNRDTHFIQLSTCSVYGDLEGPLDENSPTKPLSIYAESKLTAEKILQNSLSNLTIFRLGTVFGPPAPFGRVRNDLVVNVMTYRAALGDEIKVVGASQWRPLVCAEDIGMCVGDVVSNSMRGMYILSSLNIQIGDIAKVIKNTTKTTSEIKIEEIGPSDLRNYHVNNSKARNAGIWPVRSLQDGVKEMYDLVYSRRIKDPWSKQYSNVASLMEMFSARK
jgi:nucleoside-diphosphate-sugar epimerase